MKFTVILFAALAVASASALESESLSANEAITPVEKTGFFGKVKQFFSMPLRPLSFPLFQPAPIRTTPKPVARPPAPRPAAPAPRPAAPAPRPPAPAPKPAPPAPAPKPAPKPEPAPAPEPKPEPAPAPEPKPEPAPSSEPEQKPETASASSEPEQKPEPAPESAPAPSSEPEQKPETASASSEPEQKPEPAPESAPAPSSEPEQKPEPAPEMPTLPEMILELRRRIVETMKPIVGRMTEFGKNLQGMLSTQTMQDLPEPLKPIMQAVAEYILLQRHDGPITMQDPVSFQSSFPLPV